jgi:hypothetical protein
MSLIILISHIQLRMIETWLNTLSMLEIYLLMQRKYFKEMDVPCKASRMLIQLMGTLVH